MPAALRTPRQAGNSRFPRAAPILNHDLTELLFARQQLIEGFELTERAGLKRSTHVFVDKRFEPISQGARLRCNRIKLIGNSAFPESVQHLVGYQSSLLDPREKIFPRGQPLDLGIHRDRNGIQEVQSQVVGDEKRRWALGANGRSSEAANIETNR